MGQDNTILLLTYRMPEELIIDLDLEELTLSELLEVETALVTFMLSILLLRCCHIIVEVSRLSCIVLCFVTVVKLYEFL